jgi:hypothetical protein
VPTPSHPYLELLEELGDRGLAGGNLLLRGLRVGLGHRELHRAPVGGDLGTRGGGVVLRCWLVGWLVGWLVCDRCFHV